jgi:protein-S-isoprenylcysteine O-methyltransferase Ste14
VTAPAGSEPLKNAGVWYPPPILFVIAFLLGWLIEAKVGRLRLAESANAMLALRITGIVMLVAGLALVFWGMLTFRRAKTAI